VDDDQTPPEVTLEPADNGWVVRHHQRGSGKDQPGRTIRRVASTDDEALGHAKMAMAGGGKASKKKVSNRDGQTGSGLSDAEGESGLTSSPAAQPRSPRMRSARRRPVRSRRRV
jgi:hypothetical protein